MPIRTVMSADSRGTWAWSPSRSPWGHVIVHPREPPEQQRNSRDAVSGGVIATLFDCALGMAIASGVSSDSTEARISRATVSLGISYLCPATGHSFRAIGRPRRRGSTIAFADGTVENEHGTVCATAQGIWRLLG
jgi:uncharacterized protein (TIGR00369 family)